jgi:hypothetical protein
MKGGTPSDQGAPWFHIHQRKHHRWSLDESQINQYHLGGVLRPNVRWWEAIEVPRRSIEFVEVAELTLISLVCEDLAQHDDIAQLVRAVGPSVVLAFSPRRAAAHHSVVGAIRKRPRGRSRLRRPDAELIRDGAALPATPARCFSDRRPLERSRTRVPRDPARARRTRRSPHRVHGSRHAPKR